jgi:hypothetical protein
VQSGYQKRDWEIVDYQEYRLTWTFSARGPAPRSLKRNQYFACVGAAQTFGCFCTDPYPRLLHQQTGLEALNLGAAGAGPQFFVRNPRLIARMNKARFVILQVMSGRSEDNSVFLSHGSEWLQRRSDRVKMSAEEAYRQLLQQGDEALVRKVLSETSANWVASYRQLLRAIKPPVILFWFSQRTPDYTEQFDSVHALLGEFPQLITRPELEEITPLADQYVECVTQRGMPQLLRSRFTGEPVAVHYDRSGDAPYADQYNPYYPSPEMQVDAANALRPACSKYL